MLSGLLFIFQSGDLIYKENGKSNSSCYEAERFQLEIPIGDMIAVPNFLQVHMSFLYLQKIILITASF
jgi:hypothetical protein